MGASHDVLGDYNNKSGFCGSWPLSKTLGRDIILCSVWKQSKRLGAVNKLRNTIRGAQW